MAENLKDLVDRTVRKNFLVQDRETREHKLQPFTGRVLSLRWLQSGPEFKVIYEDKQSEYLGLQALRDILQPAGGKQGLKARKSRKPSIPRAPAALGEPLPPRAASWGEAALEPPPKRARASAPLPSVAVDLRGAAVEELPPLRDGQHRVLGHTLSAKAAHERSLITKEWSSQKEKRWAQVLTPGVDNEAVVEGLRVYLGLDVGAESRAALPSDPKLHRDLEAFTVEASDPRVGLRGQKGVRARRDTRRPIPANTILGPYRALQLTHDEWVSNGSADGLVGFKYDQRRLPALSSHLAAGSRALQCELLHETYAAECTAWNVQPERPQLVSSAFGYGNFLCLANDSAGPGDGGVPSRGSNIQFVEVLVHGWPMVFALTTENVAPGQELLVEYGEGYWNMVRSLMLRIQQAAAVAATAAQQAGAVSGGGSVQPGHLLERLPSMGELSRPS